MNADMGGTPCFQHLALWTPGEVGGRLEPPMPTSR
jgi:hypothetical protein